MRKLQCSIAGLTLLLACAGSAAAENVLRFTGTSGGPVTMDPHSFYPKFNQEETKQVYEALLDIDSNLAIVPQLALAWKSTWEFELRPDVTFHDGEPFTAADVVFSVERARAESSDFRIEPTPTFLTPNAYRLIARFRNFSAALRSRRFVAKTSTTSPSWSTARQR